MFEIGDVVVSKDGTRVEVLEFYDESPDTFGGADLKTGDVSACWERSKFVKEPRRKPMDRQPLTSAEKQRLEDLRCTVAARLRREKATVSDNFRNDWVTILNETVVAPNVCMAVLDDMIKSGLSAEQILNYDESCSK